ncbi:hypothetical protein [Streptomyces boluensis]|uniref:Uncharacterized protein n=1 Tax=Streptomyces boluensis TaxID=1775135 RepID=A0A964XNP4_9ACTN|nr:hypothetical protein [Streptomyces boluensis]NBE53992.1 hypothetical protein [Streptomyces boluensis]
MAPPPISRCVTVTLSDCRADDAHAVVDLLTGLFPYEETGGAHPVPGADPPHSPTVWAATLDVSTSPNEPPRTAPLEAPLEAPVEVTLQGAPHDVVAVHAALAEAFTLDDEGMVSGDQEQEVQLRLTSR